MSSIFSPNIDYVSSEFRFPTYYLSLNDTMMMCILFCRISSSKAYTDHSVGFDKYLSLL